MRCGRVYNYYAIVHSISEVTEECESRRGFYNLIEINIELSDHNMKNINQCFNTQRKFYSEILPKNSINHEYSGSFVFFTKQFDKITYRKVNFTIFFIIYNFVPYLFMK